VVFNKRRNAEQDQRADNLEREVERLNKQLHELAEIVRRLIRHVGTPSSINIIPQHPTPKD
jgi:hypothetical protein